MAECIRRQHPDPQKDSEKVYVYNSLNLAGGEKRRAKRWLNEPEDSEDEDELEDNLKVRNVVQGENVLKKHKEIITTIDSIQGSDAVRTGGEGNINSADSLKTAIENYLSGPDQMEVNFRADSSTSSTLLHKLSEGYDSEAGGNSDNRDIAAGYLIGKRPQLLHERDSSDHSALSKAVERKQTYFVDALLDNSQPDDQRKALTEKVRGGLTSLTMAIKMQRGGTGPVIKALLHYSRLHSLLAYPDEKGNTPLHHLVTNHYFSAKLLMSLLQGLLENAPEALEKENHSDAGGDTPYQARQRFLNSTVIVNNCKRKMDDYCVLEHPPTDKQIDGSKDKVRTIKYRFKAQGYEKLGVSTAFEFSSVSGAEISSPVSATGCREQSFCRVQDQVSELLKLHCMMHSFRTMDILYKPGKEQRSIYLDLTAYHEQKITYEKLSYMANPRFETILQFVRIPQICVDSPPPDPEPPSNSKKRMIRAKKGPERKPRRDFEHIFRWLKQQGVVRILEVEVIDFGDDPGYQSHGDEVIERALKPFQVSTWNWKRYEICSSTILAAAPKVKKVYLYSRGNGAVLWGWSGADGLNRLLELESVHLVVQPQYDSEERTDQNIQTFRARMAKYAPKVKTVIVEVDLYGSLGSGLGRIDDDATQSSDRWMDIMRGWARFTLTFSQAPAAGARKRPIVAVLDDGVDVMRDDIKDRLIGGRSFKQTPEMQRFSGYQVGAGSHGTIMASLVLQMCPQATILPIRLDTRRSSKRGGAPCFTIRSAAEAVEWAILQDVDIISMSWSIEETSDDQKIDLDHLKLALTTAASKNIILFCATSDKGNATPDKLYPGCCVPNILRIGASTSTGEVSALVRSRNVDFIFPGEGVEISIDRKRTADGSSIATALAAGMAAMLLHCADKVISDPEKHKEYHTHAAIHRAFRKMGGTPESSPKVKEYFEETKDWQLKVAGGEWQDLLRWTMYQAGILENSVYHAYVGQKTPNDTGERSK